MGGEGRRCQASVSPSAPSIPQYSTLLPGHKSSKYTPSVPGTPIYPSTLQCPPPHVL